jgi:hypothetical protein
MPKPRQSRRKPWPNHAEEFRLEALQNANHSAKGARRARELVSRILQRNYHRDDPATVELLLTKVALLLAEIEIDQVRIDQVLTAAVQTVLRDQDDDPDHDDLD